MRVVYGLPLPRLKRNSLKDLPPFLIDGALRNLKDPVEPPKRGALESLPDLIYSVRYQRMALPQNTWRQCCSGLLYCRQDFRMIHLPDSFFWAYAPLRPLFFVWRKLSH